MFEGWNNRSPGALIILIIRNGRVAHEYQRIVDHRAVGGQRKDEALDLTKASMWTVRRRIGQKRRPCLCDFDAVAPILTGGFLVRDFRKPFSAVIAEKMFSGVVSECAVSEILFGLVARIHDRYVSHQFWSFDGIGILARWQEAVDAFGSPVRIPLPHFPGRKFRQRAAMAPLSWLSTTISVLVCCLTCYRKSGSAAQNFMHGQSTESLSLDVDKHQIVGHPKVACPVFPDIGDHFFHHFVAHEL